LLLLFVVREEPQGHVISVDLQHVRPLPGATVLDNCDITSAETWERIKQVLDGRFVDVVLSDMAPAASGVKSLDHDRIVELAMSVLRLSASIMTEVCVYFSVTLFFFIYTVSKKNIPNIFDCNLKTNYQILIIFGTNITDTTCHQTIVRFPTSPNVCFCTT